MIVWTGAGIVVFFAALIGGATGLAIGGQWGCGIALLLVAVGIWFLGRKLNASSNARILVDVQTGERVELHRTHTLFWIRMEYWAFVVGVCGVIAFFVK